MSSKIEWTEDTWNPLLGCTKVSPGCKNCYAIRTAWIRMHNRKMANRYAGTVEKTAAGALNWTGKINVVTDVALKPLRIKKPTVFFVNSMSDLFHEAVLFEVIDQVFAVMALCPQHTFQVLTKRPARMLEYLQSRERNDYIEIQEQAEIIVGQYPDVAFAKDHRYNEDGSRFEWITNELQPHLKAAGWYSGISYVGEEGEDKEWEFIYEGVTPFPNIWLGVSVENQAAADERIPLLLQAPAAVRFLSCEPLLGPVIIPRVDFHCDVCGGTGILGRFPYGQCRHCNGRGKIPAISTDPAFGRPSTPMRFIHWVICGGESGPGARPMHPDWARSLRDQCKAAGVPFFFKQWGAWLPRDFNKITQGKFGEFNFRHQFTEGSVRNPEHYGIEIQNMQKVGKKEGGRLLDGMEWNEMPNNR